MVINLENKKGSKRMKVTSFKKRLLTLLMSGVLACSMAFTAFAADGTGSRPENGGGTDTGGLLTMLEGIYDAGTAQDATDTEKQLVLDAYSAVSSAAPGAGTAFQLRWDGVTVSFSNTTTDTNNSSVDMGYVDLYNSVSALKAAAGQVANSSSQSIQEVQGDIKQISNMNTKANITAGTDIMSPFLGPIQVAMGAVVTLAVWLLGLITALDVFYMVIPPFNSLMNAQAEGGGKLSGQTKSGEIKCKLVSDDAVDAYKVYEESQKNPIVTYMKKRFITYIAAALAIYLLLSGNMGQIISVVLNLLSGLIETLAGVF